ncbi:hypothetical protein E4191_14640 [Paracoccus liaowanqingii]|uniref:Uncharacterized protein n=1 Tax=Paracoccus liaowanqingii TaxID=2560053 RepID=A0A4P7HNC0_9RHOB|nr:hypothetical protein [Paracoccus liaowanqingii]QBX35788.1 hypothetical protein E4191_14640 [Paracoccus liaowanqingii]
MTPGLARRLLAVVAVLALVLMSAWLPARPLALPGSLLPSHEQLSDTALPTGQAVLDRPAAPALPKGLPPGPGDLSAPDAPAPRVAAWAQSGTDASLSGPPRPATRPRAPPALA